MGSELTKTLVVIPAYNEEASLEYAMGELEGYLGVFGEDAFDYIIVNDGSTDSTRSICIERGYAFLDLPVNTGLASAFQAGMKYALRHDYDYVVQLDGDGQHNPIYLKKLVDAARDAQADIVIGSRFIEHKKGVSMRELGSRLLVAMIRLTTGHSISDPTSGLRLFGRDMIARFAVNSDYAPEPDTVAFAMHNGAKVVEISVEMRERYGGKSYLTAAKSAGYMIRMALSILLYQWFRKE